MYRNCVRLGVLSGSYCCSGLIISTLLCKIVPAKILIVYVIKNKNKKKNCQRPGHYYQTLKMTTKRKVYITLSDSTTNIFDLLPSNKGRQSLVQGLIEAYKLIDLCDGTIHIYPAQTKDLTTYHDEEFVKHLMEPRTSLDKYSDQIDAGEADLTNVVIEENDLDEKYGLVFDCYPFPCLGLYVLLTAASSINAARKIVQQVKETNYQIIAVNWYGGRHHCHKSQAAGFCYVNDVVLSINILRKNLGPVFYLDLDLHHGDGVESAFKFSKKVATCSIHRYDVGFYPGTGSLKSSRENTYNIPTGKGLNNSSMLWIIKEIVTPLIVNFGPKAIVIQCGCDGLALDTHKEWNMTIKGYRNSIEWIINYFSEIPIMLLGGGGYNHTETAKCWTYLTGLVLRVSNIDTWDIIPEHKNLDAYEEDGFRFWTDHNTGPSKMKDHNSVEYLNEIKAHLLSL